MHATSLIHRRTSPPPRRRYCLSRHVLAPRQWTRESNDLTARARIARGNERHRKSRIAGGFRGGERGTGKFIHLYTSDERPSREPLRVDAFRVVLVSAAFVPSMFRAAEGESSFEKTRIAEAPAGRQRGKAK